MESYRSLVKYARKEKGKRNIFLPSPPSLIYAQFIPRILLYTVGHHMMTAAPFDLGLPYSILFKPFGFYFSPVENVRNNFLQF